MKEGMEAAFGWIWLEKVLGTSKPTFSEFAFILVENGNGNNISTLAEHSLISLCNLS